MMINNIRKNNHNLKVRGLIQMKPSIHLSQMTQIKLILKVRKININLKRSEKMTSKKAVKLKNKKERQKSLRSYRDKTMTEIY